jgi:hypothetical protein
MEPITLSYAQKQNAGDILEKLAKSIDLTETQYRDAIERYEAVGTFLAHPTGSLAAYNPRLVPQGSFRIGTVVRPDHEECEFDVDTTCWLLVNLPDRQYRIKSLIALRLNSSEVYRKMLKEKHRCWRLIYSEATRFHLDIVPAVADDYQWLIQLGVPQKYACHAVKITDNQSPKYYDQTSDWPRSNPEGYALWFLDVMKIYADEIRMKLASEMRMSMDKIPEYKVRTPLQRSIQLMKRHRDQMYGDDELRPISIIITTLAAKSYADVMKNNQSRLFYDIVLSIVEKMPNYIENKMGVKWVTNPVNPTENFADKWHIDSRLEQRFYEWHRAFVALLKNEHLTKPLTEITTKLSSSFGAKTVNRALTFQTTLPEQGQIDKLRNAATLLSTGKAFTNEFGHITDNSGIKNQDHHFHCNE